MTQNHVTWSGSEDVADSMRRALVRDGWIWGDRFARIGHPFVWIDQETSANETLQLGVLGLLQWMSGAYEFYPTPESIRTKDFDREQETLISLIRDIRAHFAPCEKLWGKFGIGVECWAETRLQDYCFIKTFCPSLPASGLRHVDIGPGWGSHAFYSLPLLGSTYFGIEANPYTYRIQRLMFRFLATKFGPYLDPVLLESLGLTPDQVSSEIDGEGSAYPIRSVPSWYFRSIRDQSIDLVTSVWVFNEVTASGVTWLLSNAMRVLKSGGILYLRDSEKAKPGRHPLNYDEMLEQCGFERVARLDLRNRIDMWGIPRAYRKTAHVALSFEEAFERFFGKGAITIQKGEYQQHNTIAEG